MLMAIPRCDQCDTALRVGQIERDRKRFCCLVCLRAFVDGDLRPSVRTITRPRPLHQAARADPTREARAPSTKAS